ncbi:MAG: hypothetical protein ACLGIP_18435 [Alphaproteobacteria bacterium]
MRVTVACPEALISDANHLAMVLAFSEADGMTYRGLNWRDAAGNLYAAASFEARPEWIIGAQSTLARPAWDTDQKISMAAAVRAQAALVFAQEATPAMPDKLTAIAGPDGPEALAMMGLEPVEVE